MNKQNEITKVKINGREYEAQELDMTKYPNVAKDWPREWYLKGKRGAEGMLMKHVSGEYRMLYGINFYKRDEYPTVIWAEAA